MTGGGSNYLKKMQNVDDHLNSLKFLESGIQEEKIGKDDYGSQIGLFNFVVSESKKELKDKHLLEDTKKLYDELKQDKEILGKYYSSNIKLTRDDMKKFIDAAGKTDSNAHY